MLNRLGLSSICLEVDWVHFPCISSSRQRTSHFDAKAWTQNWKHRFRKVAIHFVVRNPRATQYDSQWLMAEAETLAALLVGPDATAAYTEPRRCCGGGTSHFEGVIHGLVVERKV